MQTIPDTGGGLSGFIASLIWHGYRHFPSQGRWDWLLLFFALAGFGIALFWPYLWKAISADMEVLKARKNDVSGQQVVLFFWSQLWQWLLIWFFYTDAGKTLLAGRPGSLSEVSRTLFWISLGVNLVVIIGLGTLGTSLEDRIKSMAAGFPMPLHDRSLLHLYAGGGIFYSREKDGTTKLEPAGMMIILLPVIGFLTHVFYWYWSAASIVLMHTITCTVVLNEIVRMTFVYILHRRTFG